MPRRGCGYVLRVRHQCTNAVVCPAIRDCGPRTRSFCGELTCCNGVCRSNRILDLTPKAFSAIGSLSAGKLPVWIYN
jgi:hypothetical protein